MLKEKTLNARKKIILLRSFFAVAVVFCLVIGITGPVVVNAADYPSWSERLDWTALDYSVRYGNESNIVTIPLDSRRYVVGYMTPNANKYEQMIIGQEESRIIFQTTDDYRIDIFPASSYGLTTDSLPTGAVFSCDVTLWFASEDPVNVYPASLYSGCYYLDDNGRQFNFYYDDKGTEYTFGNTISFSFPVEYVENSVAVVPRISIRDFTVYTEGIYYITIHNPKLTMEVSTAFWNSFENRLNGEKLDDIKDELGSVNDKLDDTNEKLDELPGEIGDEMQGVIDKENDKAESSGNKFVNQILDKLPDPSTDVLAALKSLTDATAYTGTDANLTIPAIVIPEIDGLFPATEIWGGTEFSFGDFLEFLPPTLLTVVQSLFTIAIVLYCVYELKGIISYCLTLNDKKGG